jgi:DNA polymerase-3 subunit beta
VVAHRNYASFKASLAVVTAVAAASEPPRPPAAKLRVVKERKSARPKRGTEPPPADDTPEFGRSVDLDAFTAALKRLASVADSKSPMPILGHVAMRVLDGEIALHATDLNMALAIRVPSLGSDTRLGMCVPAKAALDIARLLPGSRVTIQRTESGATFTSDSGKVQNRIVGIPDRDFPKIPDSTDIATSTIDSAVLVDLIRSTLHSVCKDETRFHLNGGFLESDGGRVSLVTTDGHRLTRATRGGSLVAMQSGRIIPAAALAELGKLLAPGTCEVGFSGPNMFVRQSGMEFSTKCIDAQFPPYDQVIPKGCKSSAVVSREDLLAAMKRASLMSDETRGVKIATCDESGELLLTTTHPDMGTMSERLDATIHGAFGIGAKPEYVIEALKALKMTADTDTVTLEFGAPLDPMIIRPTERPIGEDSVLSVIMPMRLD